MNYDRYDRALIAEAFKASKKYLKRHGDDGGTDDYICLAIMEADIRGDISMRQTNMAKQVIDERLGAPNGCVRIWLANQGIPAEQLTYDNVQAYRHRWLDSLIEEFSQKG